MFSSVMCMGNCAVCAKRQPRPAPSQIGCHVRPPRHGRAGTRHHGNDAKRGLTGRTTRPAGLQTVPAGFAMLGTPLPSPNPAARGFASGHVHTLRLALTLRALSVRAERKGLVSARSMLRESFLPAGIIQVRWMASEQSRIAHSSVWRPDLLHPRKDQFRPPC